MKFNHHDRDYASDIYEDIYDFMPQKINTTIPLNMKQNKVKNNRYVKLKQGIGS